MMGIKNRDKNKLYSQLRDRKLLNLAKRKIYCSVPSSPFIYACHCIVDRSFVVTCGDNHMFSHHCFLVIVRDEIINAADTYKCM